MSPTEQLRYRNMEDFGYGSNVMKKTKVCPNCGKMVNARFRNCPDCGGQLSSETLFAVTNGSILAVPNAIRC